MKILKNTTIKDILIIIDKCGPSAIIIGEIAKLEKESVTGETPGKIAKIAKKFFEEWDEGRITQYTFEQCINVQIDEIDFPAYCDVDEIVSFKDFETDFKKKFDFKSEPEISRYYISDNKFKHYYSFEWEGKKYLCSCYKKEIPQSWTQAILTFYEEIGDIEVVRSIARLGLVKKYFLNEK